MAELVALAQDLPWSWGQSSWQCSGKKGQKSYPSPKVRGSVFLLCTGEADHKPACGEGVNVLGVAPEEGPLPCSAPHSEVWSKAGAGRAKPADLFK